MRHSASKHQAEFNPQYLPPPGQETACGRPTTRVSNMKPRGLAYGLASAFTAFSDG
jgi:hypothetical protein